MMTRARVFPRYACAPRSRFPAFPSAVSPLCRRRADRSTSYRPPSPTYRRIAADGRRIGGGLTNGRGREKIPKRPPASRQRISAHYTTRAPYTAHRLHCTDTAAPVAAGRGGERGHRESFTFSHLGAIFVYLLYQIVHRNGGGPV